MGRCPPLKDLIVLGQKASSKMQRVVPLKNFLHSCMQQGKFNLTQIGNQANIVADNLLQMYTQKGFVHPQYIKYYTFAEIALTTTSNSILGTSRRLIVLASSVTDLTLHADTNLHL